MQNRYAAGPIKCDRARRGGKRELLRLFVGKSWRAMGPLKGLHCPTEQANLNLLTLSKGFESLFLSRSLRFDGSGKCAHAGVARGITSTTTARRRAMY